MKKIIIKGLDEKIYHETLDNGLNIYIYKKSDFAEKGAFFATNYGSNKNDFVPIGKTEMKSFPKGIAHFLEHKLFESDDTSKTFDIFKKLGAYVNAYTNVNITNYYFSTVYNFDKCLEELLNFVQTPYFTNKNVEKEKGIINQEINMVYDNISSFMFQKSKEITLFKDPNKYPVIGDKKNVNKITKEDLYECYNTFYHPSNMFLIIYGDVNVKKTIELIRKNQAKKKFESQKTIELKKYTEKDEVKIPYKAYYKNVNNSRIVLCYKIKTSKLTGKDKYRKTMFLGTLLDMKFGGTSPFERILLKEKVINAGLSWTFSIYNDVILLYFITVTDKKDEFIKRVEEKLKETKFDKHSFELIKKSNVAAFIRDFERPARVANLLVTQINKYDGFIDDIYEVYKNYTFEEFKKEFNTLNFNNKSVVYVTNKEVKHAKGKGRN